MAVLGKQPTSGYCASRLSVGCLLTICIKQPAYNPNSQQVKTDKYELHSAYKKKKSPDYRTAVGG